MLNIAKEKARKTCLDIEFQVMDVREMQLNKVFDACIAMFTVIGFLVTNEDLQRAMHNLRAQLREGSLFIFDFWYGPAVLTQGASITKRTFEKDGMRIIRLVHPQQDILRHVCECDLHLIVIRRDKVVDEVRERHTLRYLFPQEIKHYLEEEGFELLKFCPLSDLEGKVTEETWHVTAISKAVKLRHI